MKTMDNELLIRQPLPNKKIKFCRYCKWFVRVREEKLSFHIRGFCVFGQNEGCYDLFLNTSYASECPFFVFDEKNYLIEMRLERLRDMMWKKEKKFSKELMKKKLTSKEILNRFLLSRQLAYEETKRENLSELIEIHNEVKLTKKDYSEMLSLIHTLILKFLKYKRVQVSER